MARTPKRRAPRLRPGTPEPLEARSLLSTTAGGMWPLNNPSPTNSLLVGFAPTMTPLQQQQLLGEFGAYVAQRYESGPVLITLGRGVAPSQALPTFKATPGVLYAEQEQVLTAQLVPNDPSFPQQWALSNTKGPDIQATQAWDITTGNPAVVVADIDTGIDYTNPDTYLNIWINQAAIPAALKSAIVHTDGLPFIDFADLNSLNAQGQVVTNAQGQPVNASYTSHRDGKPYIDAADLVGDPTTGLAADPNWVPSGSTGDLIGESFLNNGATVNNTPRDDNGHGTMTGGIIGAMTNDGTGVAAVDWNARIMPLKFLDASGSGYDTDGIAAIDYAADHGAKVINASWGDTQDDPALDQAISYADSKGVLFVAAAGNNAQSNDNSSTAFYPASSGLPNVISVAAVDSSGNLASFSNYGAKTVNLGAPGVGIYSTKNNGTVTSGSGTSFAAPQVSGVAALVAGVNPSLSPEQIIQVLDANVQPLSSLSGKTITGGMVDAYKAVSAVATATHTGPSATFLGTDTTTVGNWRNAYGGDGYDIPNDTSGTNPSFPGYATVALAGTSTTTWSSTTTDPRALEKISGTGRKASCWYTHSSYTIDVNLTDGQAHRVGVYALDWDRYGRSERVDVLDAATGKVLDSRSISSFSGGEYLSWTLQGHVVIKVTNLKTSGNAVLSGLFFGA